MGELVPDATGLWAPDVERLGEAYHLYYAASTFGSGWSCIGHATSSALDPPAWQDQGPIVCSDADGVDVDWDAIDPSALVAPDGSRWLAFDSFGSGIQLLELDASGVRATDELVALAKRPEAPHAVQAPFLWCRAPSTGRAALFRRRHPSTIEMPALVAQELGDERGFLARPSGEFRCSPEGEPWSGALYASENDGGATVLGEAPPTLEALVQQGGSELARSVDRRARLWYLSTKVPRTTPANARSVFQPLLAQDDRDPVSHYAWAVEVDLQEGSYRAALAHLERAAALNEEPALFEPWLRAWIANQRGAIALRRGRRELAEREFATAEALLPLPEVVAFAERQRALVPK